MTILIATTNPGKFKEIAEILAPLQREFVSLADLGITVDFEENEDTFEGNALGKARFFAEQSGLPAVADDSGIIVEALANELGVKTRRWGAGAEATDQEWLDFFMNRMSQEEDRRARFVAAAALVTPEGEQVFLGETHGYITESLEAPIHAGVPLSSVFKPEGSSAVYSALPVEEKNSLSHRGKAFIQLLNHLQNA